MLLHSSRSGNKGASAAGATGISNPVYTENVKTYTQISQTMSSLHSQQVYFGGFYGHNDPISPMTGAIGPSALSGKRLDKSLTAGSKGHGRNDNFTGASNRILIEDDTSTVNGGPTGPIIYQKRMNRLQKLLTNKISLQASPVNSNKNSMNKIDLLAFPGQKRA